jgi:hypothetical protein
MVAHKNDRGINRDFVRAKHFQPYSCQQEADPAPSPGMPMI